MNDMDNKQDALWKDFQRQCTKPDGLPTYEQYVTQRIAELEAALEPFARAAEELEPDYRTVLRWGMLHELRILSVTTEHLLAARAALKGQGDANVS